MVSIFLTAAVMDSSEVMSSWTEEAENPSEVRSEATFSPDSALREPMMTWYPWSLESCVATARPIPEFPPEMRTIVLVGELIVVVEFGIESSLSVLKGKA